jgi:hypothetical protein
MPEMPGFACFHGLFVPPLRGGMDTGVKVQSVAPLS